MIRGKVVAADNGRPLRRARVSASGIGLGRDSGRTTSTGLDGSYVFKNLPAARYRVSVTRGGYLPLEHGQRRPGEQGRPIDVADGQTVDKIDFALPRMSSISGRITDEGGEAIEGVAVYAVRSLFYEGARRLVPVGGVSVRTDDEGEYRLQRLAPGTYQVMASTRETWTVVENGRETVYGYMTTYFPGTATPTESRRVRLGIGEQVRAIDFALVPGRAAKISGTAVDSQGRPFSRVALSVEVRGIGFASFGAGPPVRVAADGSFVAENVPPGEYTLEATRPADTPEGAPEVALMTVNIEGTDLDNITLVGSGGGTVSGRVIGEEGSLPKPSEILVNVAPTYRNQPPPAMLGIFRASGPPRVKEDGTFSAQHVLGRARFAVTLPDGWMLKRVQHEGRDLTDAVVELRSGERITGVEVIITDRVTQLGGTVVDDKGVPVGDATVLVFPADSDRWFENSRSMRATRPDQKGQWQIKALPAGDYLAIALEYVEDVAWQDPEYLESLRQHATKITVPDGGAQTATLKLAVPR